MQEIEMRWRLQNQNRFADGLAGLGVSRVLTDGYFSRTVQLLRSAHTDNSYTHRLRMTVRFDADGAGASCDFMLATKTKSQSGAALKIREEQEQCLDSSRGLSAHLTMLRTQGYRSGFVYEEIRHDMYVCGVTVSMRAFPFIGVWVEIEGPQDDIARAAEALGLSVQEAVSENWQTLFREHCAKNRVPATHMTFEEYAKCRRS